MNPSPEIWQLLLLFGIGLVAGVINVLAGGGSLLTMPLLIFLGLPAAMANGTNRVAILLQNIVAVQGFRHRGRLPLKPALLGTGPAAVGGVLGARLALDMDDSTFRLVLAGVMLMVAVLMIVDPARRWRFPAADLTPRRIVIWVALFFLVGIYGGFIQAGVGFIMITGLLAFGLDLVRINAIKVFVVMVFTLCALPAFAWAGQVNWPLGLTLAAGNMVGGWLGSQLAVSKGHGWLRKMVLVVTVLLALKLLLWR